MINYYSFDEKNKFSKRGIKIIEKYLSSLDKTLSIKNVEDDVNYQNIDIDLIWTFKKNNVNIVRFLEVKTDNYTTGNFWIETISNEKKGTIGCFLKSHADFFYYYFIKWDSVYIIPMKQAKKWFQKNMDNFSISKTKTKDNHNNYSHTTVGRIVPIKIMMENVQGIKLMKNLSKKVNNQ